MPEKREDKRQLYFIAIILPEPYSGEVMKLKHYFRDHYGSKASLNSPAHITLHMPFQWKEEKDPVLLTGLQRFASQKPPMDIGLIGFGCFPPRVIFIDVEKTNALQEFQLDLHRFCKVELNLFNANYKEHPFNPHVTLAFRDLKKQTFQLAWKEFCEKDFSGKFIANTIALLKHNGKIWEVFKEFKLMSSAN